MNKHKSQAGFTLTELLVVIVWLAVMLFWAFIAFCVVYAAGKFLFGWW